MEYLHGIPKTLYKYRAWDQKYHQRLLTYQEVFLSSPANLNDPFDASLPFRYKQEELTKENIFKKLIQVGRRSWPDMEEIELERVANERLSSGVFENGDYWKEQHEDSKASLHKSFGILSMTTKNDNLLMWAHYANCHRGFCVGFNSEKLFESIGGMIGKVNYAESFPLMSLIAPDTTYMVQMLNTKSTEWKYEDEYRLTKGGASNVTFTMPAEVITEVVLGCNMSSHDQVEIVDLLKFKLPHVKLYKASTSLDHFRLDVQETSI